MTMVDKVLSKALGRANNSDKETRLRNREEKEYRELKASKSLTEDQQKRFDELDKKFNPVRNNPNIWKNIHQ